MKFNLKKAILMIMVIVFGFSSTVEAMIEILLDTTRPSITDENSYYVTNKANLIVSGVDSRDRFSAYKILDTFYNETTKTITYGFTTDFKNFLNSSDTYNDLTVEDYMALISGSRTSENTNTNTNTGNSSARPSLDDVHFLELDWKDFDSENSGPYNIPVEYSINKVTPVITNTSSNVTYEILDSLNLNSGNNNIRIKATDSTTGYMRTYTFVIVRSYQNDFSYIGEEQEYIVPETRNYMIELWGAGRNKAGGGYTKGKIHLIEGEKLYFYVGGQGMQCTSTENCIPGYNGGGSSGFKVTAKLCNTGNGATDVRLVNGEWNNIDSLKSRIMVAGGAGGNGTTSDWTKSGSAGGLTGYRSSAPSIENNGYPGTQIAGGKAGTKYGSSIGEPTPGGFGYGGNGNAAKSQGWGGGGGGGYYGGGGGSGVIQAGRDGAGGSSFISGHAGAIAINEDGTPKVTTYSAIEDSYHYSGKIFTETEMIDGRGYMKAAGTSTASQQPKPTGGYYTGGQGHLGNGYARITALYEHGATGLSSLTVSGTTNNYTPSFSSTIYEYDLELSKGEQTITINAVPEDQESYVTGTGTFNVQKGKTDYMITVTSYDGQVVLYTIHVTANGFREPSYLEDLVSAYAGYIKTHPEVISTELVTSGTTATLSNADSGSYLVLPTATSRVYAVMVGNIGLTLESGELISKDGHIVAKVSDASITKYVETKSQTEATYSYGEDIPYFIIASVPRYPLPATNKKYEIVDTMDTGLSFKSLSDMVVRDGETSLTVNSNGTIVNANSETVGIVTLNGQTIKISIDVDKVDSMSLEIKYLATLTDEAPLGITGVKNVSTLTFSNDPYGTGTKDMYSGTAVYTYGISILKFETGKSNVTLEGAKFEVYKSSDLDISGLIDTLVTRADGTATLRGIKAGTYYLKEVEAPVGYTLNNDPIEVVVNDTTVDLSTGTVKSMLENKKIGTLPVTGDMGTLIFTISGAVLMVGAISFIYIYRKDNSQEG